MSGGSYDYLCNQFCQTDELIPSGLPEMVERLDALGYAADAARESRELLSDLRAAQTLWNVTQKRLFGVWKAVEWWDSCDWSEAQVRDALTKYRGVSVRGADTPATKGE